TTMTVKAAQNQTGVPRKFWVKNVRRSMSENLLLEQVERSVPTSRAGQGGSPEGPGTANALYILSLTAQEKSRRDVRRGRIGPRRPGRPNAARLPVSRRYRARRSPHPLRAQPLPRKLQPHRLLVRPLARPGPGPEPAPPHRLVPAPLRRQPAW